MGALKDKIDRKEAEARAYNKMISYGWTPAQAAGIVGNLNYESRLDTTILGTADTKGSRGIAQWHSGRLNDLQSRYGKDWTNLDNQLEFVNWELNNTYKSAGDKIRTINHPMGVGQVVSDMYERPKVKYYQNTDRQKAVLNTYKNFADPNYQYAPIEDISYKNSVEPYMNQTSQVSNLPTSKESDTLADETEDEDNTTEEEDNSAQIAQQKIQEKQNEYNFVQDYIKNSQLQYVDPNQGVAQSQEESSNEPQVYQDGGLRNFIEVPTAYQAGGIQQFTKKPFQLQDERQQAVRNTIPNLRPNVGTQLTNAQIEQRRIQELKDKQGDIHNYTPQTTASRVQEVALNPLTAFGYTARNESLPEHFSKGERNSLDSALDIVNPAFYLNQGNEAIQNTGSAISNVSQGNLPAAYKDIKNAGMNVLNVAPAVSEFAPEIREGLKALGTEEGLLSNAYKLNPWAFKPSTENYYRGLGETGFKDAVETGKFRQAGVDSGVPRYNEVWYANGKKGFERAKDFSKEYIAEVPEDVFQSASLDKFRGSPGMQTRGTTEHIPISQGKILQKDWLQGYKQIEVPKTSIAPEVRQGNDIELRKELFSNLDVDNEISNSLADKKYNKIPFDAKKYTTEDLNEINNYSLDSGSYKRDPKLIQKIENIIIKNKGEEFPLIRHFGDEAYNNINEKDLLENKGYLETNSPLSFSAYKGINHFGKNRILLTKPTTQSYFKTGMDIGAGEREIILPSKLRYDLQKKVANEIGGIDYHTIINNPYILVPPVIGAGALSQINNQNPQYQSGGIIQDNNGQWTNPGQPTLINSNTITMKPNPITGEPLKDPLLLIADTGERRMAYPGEGEIKFEGATKVLEIPKTQTDKNYQPIGKGAHIPPSMQQGGTVREQYENITGKPWQSAKAEGLTNGTAEQNLRLIQSLKNRPSENNTAPQQQNENFTDIFNQNRQLLGANKIFEYNGKKYGTNLQGEEFKPSEEDILHSGLPLEATKNRLNEQNRQLQSIYTTKNTIKVQENYEDWDKVKQRNKEINNLDNASKIIKYQSQKPEDQYLVVDKVQGKMHLYQGNKELASYNVGTGQNEGDDQTKTWVDKETKKVDWSKGNKSTGAGVYSITNTLAKNSHYSDAPSFNMQNEQGIEVPMAIHAGFGDRIAKIADNNPNNNRVSNGCVNGLCHDLKDLYQHDIKKGTKVYVLPDNPENKFEFENGKLNFKSKNSNVNRTVNTLNYKPIKTSIDEKSFKNDVFQWSDFNDEEEYNKTTKPFVQALQDNKKNIMKAAKINGDVYNDIAKVTFGIYGTESNFGDTHGAEGNFLRAVGKAISPKSSSSPDYLAKATTYGANKNNQSVGLTQIRFSYLNEDEKKALKEVGVTSNTDFLDPKKAAIGTAVVLGIRYNQQLNDKEKSDILTNLPKKWNTRSNYSDRVKNNSKYLQIKELN